MLRREPRLAMHMCGMGGGDGGHTWEGSWRAEACCAAPGNSGALRDRGARNGLVRGGRRQGRFCHDSVGRWPGPRPECRSTTGFAVSRRIKDGGHGSVQFGSVLGGRGGVRDGRGYGGGLDFVVEIWCFGGRRCQGWWKEREPDDTMRRRRGGRRGSRWCQNYRALVYWVARNSN